MTNSMAEADRVTTTTKILSNESCDMRFRTRFRNCSERQLPLVLPYWCCFNRGMLLRQTDRSDQSTSNTKTVRCSTAMRDFWNRSNNFKSFQITDIVPRTSTTATCAGDDPLHTELVLVDPTNLLGLVLNKHGQWFDRDGVLERIGSLDSALIANKVQVWSSLRVE